METGIVQRSSDIRNGTEIIWEGLKMHNKSPVVQTKPWKRTALRRTWRSIQRTGQPARQSRNLINDMPSHKSSLYNPDSHRHSKVDVGKGLQSCYKVEISSIKKRVKAGRGTYLLIALWSATRNPSDVMISHRTLITLIAGQKGSLRSW